MMNIGIIGNGTIVKLWLEGALESKALRLHSAYLRSKNKKSFFQDFGIENIYTDLEDFLEDKEAETIYIALPNSLHYEYALKAIRAGKNVILEKPFTTNSKEAVHLFEEAEKNNVFIFEGICNIFDPNFIQMKAVVKKPAVVFSTFHQLSSRYKALLDGETPNVFNPDFSGGVLMDLLVYQIHACYGLFGNPEKITYFPRKYKNGIDLSGTILMEYKDFNATLLASKEAESDNQFVCINAENSIRTEGGISLMKGFYFNDEFRSYNRYENYLAYEIEVFCEIIENKDNKKYKELKDSTLAVMNLLDESRRSANIVFKNDSRGLL